MRLLRGPSRVIHPKGLRNGEPTLTCIGMKYLLMGDDDRWKSVSPCARREPSATIIKSFSFPMNTIHTWHGSTRLKPSKKLWLDLLVGKVVVDSGAYYSVAECWKLHGSKR